MPHRFTSTFIIAALTGALTATPPLAEPLNLSPVAQSRAAEMKAPSSMSPVKSRVVVKAGNESRLLKPTTTRVSKSPVVTSPKLQSWMSGEIAEAWSSGYRGQGTTLTVVDDFSSRNYYAGNLGTGSQSLRHGEWTRLESSMIATSSTVASHDFASGRTVALARTGLNVVNLSYGMMAKSGYSVSQIGWSAQENSLITYARNGNAVIAKAAGNDAVAIGGTNRSGNTDYLNLALAGTRSAIFVGALDRNGTVTNRANLASYSNFAGSDPTVQSQFLTVGVRGDLTGLYGTSFAAPVVSGYAAVLGSKFTTATPTQITNRLLTTARTDTINNYSAAVHGRGEASISRALAPSSID
jgi:subtilisin family serine protease